MFYLLSFLVILLSGGLALIVFSVTRQLGVIARRIPPDEESVDVRGLELGVPCPVDEFMTTQNDRLAIPGFTEGPFFILAASFSCNVCRPIIENLSELSMSHRKSFFFLCLDQNVQKYFGKFIAKHDLSKITMVEGMHLAAEFRIRRTPFLMAFDPEGKLTGSRLIYSVTELKQFMNEHGVMR